MSITRGGGYSRAILEAADTRGCATTAIRGNAPANWLQLSGRLTLQSFCRYGRSAGAVSGGSTAALDIGVSDADR
jgi:hypothetical protein